MDSALSEDLQSLTPRQREVFEHLVCGESEKAIAGQMGLSRHTVHAVIKTLYRRLSVNSRAQLLAILLKDREMQIAELRLRLADRLSRVEGQHVATKHASGPLPAANV